MTTECVGSPAKPSKLMGSGDGEKHVKSSKLTVPTQERTIAPQPDSSAFMHMQAYWAGQIPPPISTPTCASSATPHPFVWGNQLPLVGSYATLPQYTVIYHPGGLHNHNAVAGLAFRVPEEEGKVSYEEDRESRRKYTGSLEIVEFVGGRSGESGKTPGSSGSDCALESGTAGSSDKSEKADQKEVSVMKKRSYDQMLADEATPHNKTTASADYGGTKHQVLGLGNLSATMPASKWGTRISSKGSSPASKILMIRPNSASGVSEPVASAKMVAHKKVMSGRQIQKRKEIEAKAKALRSETSLLTKVLSQYSEMCSELKDENDFLLEALEQFYEPDAFSALKAKDPYQIDEENNTQNQGSSSELTKSTFTDQSNSN